MNIAPNTEIFVNRVILLVTRLATPVSVFVDIFFNCSESNSVSELDFYHGICMIKIGRNTYGRMAGDCVAAVIHVIWMMRCAMRSAIVPMRCRNYSGDLNNSSIPAMYASSSMFDVPVLCRTWARWISTVL